jgi:hypothetical protein
MGIRASGGRAAVTLLSALLTSIGPFGVAPAATSRCPSFGDPMDTAVSGSEANTLNEVSGLQSSFAHPHLLWGVEDSNNGPHLYAFTDAGEMIRDLTLQGPHLINWDWEALAIDPRRGRDVIYIGDIGDNGHRRTGRDRPAPALYRIREPRVHASDAYATRTITRVKQFRFRYFTHGGVLAPRNAESMFVDPRRHDIVVITKDLETISGHPHRVRVFAMQSGRLRAGAARHLNHANQVATLTAATIGHSTGSVAADVARNGSLIVVKNYGQGFLWRRSRHQPAWEPFRRHPVGPCRVPVDGAEAITFSYGSGNRWTGLWSMRETDAPPPPLRHLSRGG